MRKIPSCMATQHPDNARAPYWHSRAFVSTHAEIKESHVCFSDLGIDEYNWDWEGKFVDEAVVDRLLQKHYHFFKKHPLGVDTFLTFRIPNPRVERQFRLARAFMVAITSSQLAKELQFSHPPIFEMILPLTETATEMIDVQQAFSKLVTIDHRLLRVDDSLKHIEVIPLFEQVDTIMRSSDIIREYYRLYEQHFKKKLSYIRPYCARSDPALNSGLVPTMLAIAVALSRYEQLEKQTGIRCFPMIGTGSLPFRGGVAPDKIDMVLEKYQGARTLTLQSAFRYDYPTADVRRAITQLRTQLHKTHPRHIDTKQAKIITRAIPLFEKPYQETIEKLAPMINVVSGIVPRRRERMLHIGLFGYARGIGEVSLPRAIRFTASLYSLGIPPELIGMGRGIKAAKKMGVWDTILTYYPHIIADIKQAGYFVNKETLAIIARGMWDKGLLDDVAIIEEELGIELGPQQSHHTEHRMFTSAIHKRIYQNKPHKETRALITRAALLRKSLG